MGWIIKSFEKFVYPAAKRVVSVRFANDRATDVASLKNLRPRSNEWRRSLSRRLYGAAINNGRKNLQSEVEDKSPRVAPRSSL